ncbi:MAG: HD domain-containing protein [bacterium]|nr:HD domain-containing protein [bacterium]MDT8366099.1 HD domain-containing protein [bacterium]
MDSQISPVTLFNLVAVLSKAMDLVSPLVVDHHKRTAWFAVHLAEEMGLRGKWINEILFSALLHDIGAFSLQERLDTLQFEFKNPHHHACLGYSLLKDMEFFSQEAKIILAHHTWWKPEQDEDIGGERVPVSSHVLHLADRVAILLGEDGNVPDRTEDVLGPIKARKGTVFMPEAVDALLGAAHKEEFWLGAMQPDLEDQLRLKVDPRFLEMGPIDLEPVARTFARIIDYRSHFTATHSAAVAYIAEVLARYLGFSENNCKTMKIAGYLHDLGKIAIPTEILEKAGRLDTGEYHRVQNHVVHTRNLLEKVPELGYGIRWASEHHERLNGSGYPEHSEGGEIAFGSRVLAMADVFAAVTEDRPYRKGVDRAKALRLLGRLTKEGYLDSEIFQVVKDNFDELSRVRATAQTDSLEDHRLRMECFDEMG